MNWTSIINYQIKCKVRLLYTNLWNHMFVKYKCSIELVVQFSFDYYFNSELKLKLTLLRQDLQDNICIQHFHNTVSCIKSDINIKINYTRTWPMVQHQGEADFCKFWDAKAFLDLGYESNWESLRHCMILSDLVGVWPLWKYPEKSYKIIILSLYKRFLTCR